MRASVHKSFTSFTSEHPFTKLPHCSPWHSSQAGKQSKPCLLQLQRFVSQSALRLQRITLRSLDGAGGESCCRAHIDCRRSCTPSHQDVACRFRSTVGPGNTPEDCGTWQRQKLGAKSEIADMLSLLPPWSRTSYIWGHQDCRQILRHYARRWEPALHLQRLHVLCSWSSWTLPPDPSAALGFWIFGRQFFCQFQMVVRLCHILWRHGWMAVSGTNRQVTSACVWCSNILWALNRLCDWVEEKYEKCHWHGNREEPTSQCPSPTTTVFCFLALSKASATIMQSASLWAHTAKHEFLCSSSLTKSMKRCLFCGLGRNKSFLVCSVMSGVNCTSADDFPFVLRKADVWCLSWTDLTHSRQKPPQDFCTSVWYTVRMSRWLRQTWILSTTVPSAGVLHHQGHTVGCHWLLTLAYRRRHFSRSHRRAVTYLLVGGTWVIQIRKTGS